MIIKIVKILFSLFKILVIFLLLTKIIDYVSDYTVFEYGLKTGKIKKESYLPNINPNIMPSNSNTVALFSNYDDTSSLEEVFRIAGIPYYLCKKVKDANKSTIMFMDIDPDKPIKLSSSEVEFLYSFVQKGGTLLGSHIWLIKNDPLRNLFGYIRVSSSTSKKKFKLLDSAYLEYLEEPNEREFTLSSMKKGPLVNYIIKNSSKAIAIYDDESDAITLNNFQKGKAILFGISLFNLRYRNLVGKDYNANSKYANGFEPMSDMIILLLKGLYNSEIKKSLTLATAPWNLKSSLLVTHDVDYIGSIYNMEKYMDMELSLGIRSTFFIQTKYLTDQKDKVFFDQSTFKILQKAQQRGFEIGSHTVLHTKNFFKLKEGNYTERYPLYKPFAFNDEIDLNNPTLSGELKVSKELLLGSGIRQIVSFRSGELMYNPKLPQVMEQNGYKYSSCFSSQDIMSYYPYRYKRDYVTLKNPSYIYEIPMTYEDEEFPPLYFRLDNALNIFQKIYNNGGVFNLLIHPDASLLKLKNLDIYFERSFVQKLPKDVWITTMRSFGDFWSIRDRIVFRYNIIGKDLKIDIYTPKDINGIAFDLHGINLEDEFYDNAKIYRGRVVFKLKKGINHWILKIL